MSMHLPVEAYLNQDWFQQEQTQLFAKTWQFIGVEADMPKEGHYQTMTISAHPIFILSTEAGELKAFHNLCRHRGMTLLEGEGKLPNQITCPYHCWTYDVPNGDLKGLPQPKLFQTIEKKELGLKTMQISTYRGMVFLNLDGQAEPLKQFLSGVEGMFGHLNPNDLEEVSVLRYDVKANWKIVVENYIDGYHLRYLHQDSLADFDLKNQRSQQVRQHVLTHQSYLNFSEELWQDYYAEWPPIADYPKQDYGAFTHMLFPNIGVIETEQMWSLFQVIPVAENHTQIVMRTWVEPYEWNRKTDTQVYNGFDESKPKTNNTSGLTGWLFGGGESSKSGEHEFLDSQDVMLEDIYVCEELQRSMHSSAFEVAAYASDGEDVIERFQQNIAAYMAPEKQPSRTL